MISSTILTLIVIPAVYSLWKERSIAAVQEEPGMSRLGVGVATLALLMLVGVPAVRAQGAGAVAQRFNASLTYAQFTAGSTARQAEWSANYERAAAPVAELSSRLHALRGAWHFFVVAESWCGDAVNSVPYIARLASANPSLDMRLLRKADAKDLLDSHRRDGQTATPLVIVYDGEFVERGAWIERPAALRAFMAPREKSLDGEALDAAVRQWRATDGGRSVLSDIVTVLEHAAAAAPALPSTQPVPR